jgi:ATP-binding cassette subfamily B protein
MLLAALFAIPMLLMGKQFGKRMGKKQTELIEVARMKDYASAILLSKECAREIRTSNAGKISQKYAQTGLEQSNAIHDTYGKSLFGWQFLLQSVSITLIAIISYTYGILRFAYTEDFTTAAFSVMFVAIMNMVSRCSRITKCFEKEANYRVKIEAMQKFFELEPEQSVEDAPNPGRFECLEFRDVTFAYTADGEPVLNHVSFRIRAGERIAIAGYNGAGKSTLVKLMLRFYDPTEGVILYNGVDIRLFAPAEYRKAFAAVFQDFFLFSMGIGENVLLGEYDQSKAGKVQEALASAGLNLADKQYERIIGREYDAGGMVFSGGQQQKIAFSRLAAKEYDFAILDEPTSAMDPVSEEELFESLFARNETRTLLLITHRLSVTQRMDRILMFEDGRLAEEGSNAELMAKDGVYAKYYRYQAKAYQKRVREQL